MGRGGGGSCAHPLAAGAGVMVPFVCNNRCCMACAAAYIDCLRKPAVQSVHGVCAVLDVMLSACAVCRCAPQLCQMACAVRMHLDHTTYDRLQSVYTYFPKPYPSTAAKGSFAGKDGLGPSTTQHTAASTGTSTAAAAGSSSRGTVRAGAILEAPPASSMPSISATGGASSVSSSSSFGRAGGKTIATTQTNVWVATTGVTSTQLQALQREQEQGASSGGGSSTGDSSSSVTATTVNAPDAAA